MNKLTGLACALLCCMLAVSAAAEIYIEDDDDGPDFGDDGLVTVATPAPTGAAALGLTPMSWDSKTSECLPNQACYLPDQAGYHDASIDVKIEKFKRSGTLIYAMYITLCDPSQFRLGTAANREPYKQAALVATMSKRFHAVCAINDDYFGYHSEGIVYRNGKQVRFNPVKHRDELIVDEQGDFHIITGTTREKWNAYLEAGGTVVHALCFGPALVVDGEINENAANTTLNLGRNKDTQRIAIGQLGPLQYLVLATDGPENETGAGFTIKQMAQLCYEMGCINAYNLDGGSSSTMVLQDRKINGVGSKKRPVGGCIWFATLVPNE